MLPSLLQTEVPPGNMDWKLGPAPKPDRFVFLQPGGLVITDVPTLVKTILGSCVSLTVRAERLGLAAVTHCLLPSAGNRQTIRSRFEALKYVDATATILFQTFTARGASLAELEVKLIGGADSLSTDGSPYLYSVGSRNVQMALKEIADRGIVPAATIVGGRTGRVLMYDTGTGDVFVKRLPARLCNFPEEL
jgi:chemotaxis protein CheD